MNCFDKFVYLSKIYMHEWIPVNGIDMVVSRYAIPTGIPCVDGLSTRPPGFKVSQSFCKNGKDHVWLVYKPNLANLRGGLD